MCAFVALDLVLFPYLAERLAWGNVLCRVGCTTAIQSHTHTHTHPFNGPFSGTTQVGRYQKGKTNLDLLKQETVSGSGISWAICKSAPNSRQITMPAPHHSSFLQAGCPSCCPTNSVKALNANVIALKYARSQQQIYSSTLFCSDMISQATALTELRFYSIHDTKQVFLYVFPAKLWAKY